MTLFTQSARLPISEPRKAPAVEVVVGVLDRHVLGNVCAVGGFGLERGYRSCECRDEGRILVKDAIFSSEEGLDAGI